MFSTQVYTTGTIWCLLIRKITVKLYTKNQGQNSVLALK